MLLQQNIQEWVWEYQDLQRRYSLIDLKNVEFGIMIGFIGYYCISTAPIADIFIQFGLWPMDFIFVIPFERDATNLNTAVKLAVNLLENSSGDIYPVQRETQIEKHGKKRSALCKKSISHRRSCRTFPHYRVLVLQFKKFLWRLLTQTDAIQYHRTKIEKRCNFQR